MRRLDWLTAIWCVWTAFLAALLICIILAGLAAGGGTAFRRTQAARREPLTQMGSGFVEPDAVQNVV